MKVPINWLKKYVEISSSVEELSDKLTSIGHMQDKPPSEVAHDAVLDLEIRQNRPDCLSLIGIAREASAVFNKKLTIPDSYGKELPKAEKGIDIQVESEALCRRFNTLTFKNVKIAPSPDWLVKALEAYGIKSINNLVDITNFVMVEVGEPIHAFGVRAFPDSKLIVRNAQQGEKFVALGKRELILTSDDLVIASVQGIRALAGVIGGVEHSINEDTHEVIVEAANYVQSSIRRTTIRHSFRTEASTRHEKFLDPRLTEYALRRAYKLIVELTGAELIGHTDYYKSPVGETRLGLSAKNIKRLGGVEITSSQVVNYLTRLGIGVEKKLDSDFEVTVPYFRTDLQLEEDIIEEVLRLHGYEHIPARLPRTPPPPSIQSKDYELEEAIRDILVGCGFDEQITEPLTREEKSAHEPVILQNSLNSEKTMLRTTLHNSLLQALEHQKKYRKESVKLFEIGRIYYKKDNEYKEEKMLACRMSGKKSRYDYAKGIVRELCSRFDFKIIESKIVVHPNSSGEESYFDISLENAQIKLEEKDVYTIPPHRIYEDFSFIVESSVKVGEVIDHIKNTSPLVKRVRLGESPRELSDNKKSIFLKVVFESKDKVLSDADVKPVRDKIISGLQAKFGAVFR